MYINLKNLKDFNISTEEQPVSCLPNNDATRPVKAKVFYSKYFCLYGARC